MLGTVSALDFSGKIMLAPMVRIGRLPMRVMALKYGAGMSISCVFEWEKRLRRDSRFGLLARDY